MPSTIRVGWRLPLGRRHRGNALPGVTRRLAGLSLLLALVAACGGERTDNPSPGIASTASAITALQRQALAARYLAIAEPANVRLDRAVDRLRDHRKRNLAAAAADLTEQASIERQFDRQLLHIAFPPGLQLVALRLVVVNEARADLAQREAATTSLAALDSLASAHAQADVRVEQQVETLRRELGLPPAEPS